MHTDEISSLLASRAPKAHTSLIDIPLCSLHVMEAGDQQPLIIVPATLSELDNWIDLVRFFGQWFHAYFFELPGHGRSTALRSEFSSDLVAQAVGQLADAIGAARFSLMGFSFGGILAMKSFRLHRNRIDRVILISPCVTKRALQLSGVQSLAARGLNGLLKVRGVREFLHRASQSRANARALARLIHAVGKVENYDQLEVKLAGMRPTLMEIVSHELDEILHAEFPRPESRAETPCHVAMSVYDPLLDYRTTLSELRWHFARLRATELTFPFHQPPRAFTLDELNDAFGETVAKSILPA